LEDFTALPNMEDKKALLLHNLDPMFNVKMAHFFTCGADNLTDQMENMAIFDVSFLRRYQNWAKIR